MKRRLISAALALALALGLCLAPLSPAAAVTMEELDSPELIGDREPMNSSLCLVYSCWYMARRRVAIERGLDVAKATRFSDYRAAATKSTSGVIVYFNYTWQPTEDLALQFGHVHLSYNPNSYDVSDLAHADAEIMRITNGVNINGGWAGSTDAEKLIEILRYLLQAHPEGIALLIGNGKNASHSVLVTGYDEESGSLLAVDPIRGGPPELITSENFYLFNRPPTNYATSQEGILRYVESLWYITNGDPERSAAIGQTDATDEPGGESAETEAPDTGAESVQDPEVPAEQTEAAEQDEPLSPGEFVDVLPEDWFAGNVRQAWKLGLMVGVSETEFRPRGDVTLIQTIILAARIHSRFITGTDNFALVEGSEWYAEYLDYARAQGLVPEDLDAQELFSLPVARRDVARLLAGALPAGALYPIRTVEDGAIPDVAADDKGAEAIYLLYRAGVLVGGEDGSFRPDSTITRAEVAAVVTRMLDTSLRLF